MCDSIEHNLTENIVTLGGRDSLGIIKAWARIPQKPETVYLGSQGLFGSPSDYLNFLNCMMKLFFRLKSSQKLLLPITVFATLFLASCASHKAAKVKEEKADKVKSDND